MDPKKMNEVAEAAGLGTVEKIRNTYDIIIDVNKPLDQVLAEVESIYKQHAPGPVEMVDLGWANGWGKEPEIVTKCRELNHKRNDQSNAPGVPYKCFTHTVWCDICGYVFKYDSS